MNTARRGAVAAGHPVTADAAAEIIRDGGNAFDGAIAALFAACIAEPVLASFGGGGFMMAHRGGSTRLFDFFVDTPRQKHHAGDIEFVSIDVDFGNATQEFHIGAGATATPGFLPGLFAIHEALGSIPMRRLVEPAIQAARDGIAVTDYQAYLSAVVGPILLWTEEAADLFGKDGRTREAGTKFKNPELASVLEIIGHEGLRIATEGEIARAMVHSVENHNGQLALEDIGRYRVAVREPESIRVGQTEVHLNPLPALGGRLIARMIEAKNQATSDGGGTSPVQLAKAIMEVDRLWRRNPDAIAADHAQPACRGTTHISVADADGNAAAVTVSNGEGNGRLVPGCGFMMNNMLGEADLNPHGFHEWRPGERLASMMAPTIAIDGDGRLTALGSGGSNRIRTAIFQVLAARFAERRHIADAVEAPRIHFEEALLDIEDLFAEDILDSLLRLDADHRLWPERNMYFGGVHAVECDVDGGFDGVGDPRRAGMFVRI